MNKIKFAVSSRLTRLSKKSQNGFLGNMLVVFFHLILSNQKSREKSVIRSRKCWTSSLFSAIIRAIQSFSPESTLWTVYSDGYRSNNALEGIDILILRFHLRSNRTAGLQSLLKVMALSCFVCRGSRMPNSSSRMADVYLVLILNSII